MALPEIETNFLAANSENKLCKMNVIMVATCVVSLPEIETNFLARNSENKLCKMNVTMVDTCVIRSGTM